MILRAHFPTKENWLPDAVRLNVSRLQFRGAEIGSWQTVDSRLIGLGFTMLDTKFGWRRSGFPSAFPLKGVLRLRGLPARGEWIMDATVHLSTFDAVLGEFPAMRVGCRETHDRSTNFFACEVVEEYGHSVLRDAMAVILSKHLSAFCAQLVDALVFALGAPTDLSSRLHYSLGSLEVSWDLPSPEPTRVAQRMGPALVSVLKSPNRQKNEHSSRVEVFYPDNGWGLRGHRSRGVRVQVYGKALKFFRIETRIEKWSAFRKLNLSTRLSPDNPIGDLFTIAQSVADHEAPLWYSILSDSVPPTHSASLAEFVCLAGTASRDRATVQQICDILLSLGSVSWTKKWERPIGRLEKNGVIKRSARGRYRLAPQWRHLASDGNATTDILTSIRGPTVFDSRDRHSFDTRPIRPNNEVRERG